MTLDRARRTLRSAITTVASHAEFARASAHCPALAAFPTPRWALSWLAETSPASITDKESLICVFIAELQRDAHPLWSSLSLLACYPMLGRLRGRVRGDALTNGELDQLVMVTFIDVLATYPLEDKRDRVFLRLRQMCQRRLFRAVRREQRYRDKIVAAEDWQLERCEQACIDQAKPHRWPETLPPARGLNPIEARDQISFLTTHAGDLLARDRLDLVIATMVRGERLRHVVERSHPALDPGEHERAYQRIKRRHSRALARLREHLAHLRPTIKLEPGERDR